MDRRNFLAGCARPAAVGAAPADRTIAGRARQKSIFPVRGGGGRRHAVPADRAADWRPAAAIATIIVENRTGGGWAHRHQGGEWRRRRTAATVLVTTGPTMYLLPMVETKPSFDHGQGFYAGVASSAVRVRVVISPAIRRAPDFRHSWTFLKANPDKTSFGVPSNGTIPHFTGSQARERISAFP